MIKVDKHITDIYPNAVGLFNVYCTGKIEEIVVVQVKANNHNQALEKVERIFPNAKDYILEVKLKS
tara:strand:+ start:1200 stop:1397 length:198 start_codon:yes stop_codon:yes gene_type:complete